MEGTNEQTGGKFKAKKPRTKQVTDPNEGHRKKFALVSDGKGGVKQIER
jgi:hypothetical protein